MSSPPKCQNKPLSELPWASKPCSDPYKTHWLCMGRCTPSLGEKQWTNPKATRVYRDDVTLLSSAQNVSEVPQDLPRKYQRAPATDQQPSWSFLEEGWPSTAGSCASGLPCNQAVQPLLPFKQINSENTASRITRRDAQVEWELSWHLIQIAASCKELFLSFISICLRKVPSAAYKCANSPFEETQLRTARSSPALSS